ncbi:MAG: hypothetical protein QW051_05100 [Candidatus Aenigmatarchaeota archaeon]
MTNEQREIFETFEKQVDQREWYVESLKNKLIDYWNFNGFLYWKKGDPLVLAIRTRDLKFFKKEWPHLQVLKKYKGITLILIPYRN